MTAAAMRVETRRIISVTGGSRLDTRHSTNVTTGPGISVNSKRLGWYIVAEPVFFGEVGARQIVIATVYRPEESEFIAGSSRLIVRFEKLDTKLLTDRAPQA